MSNDPHESWLETRLLQEIGEINDKIQSLEGERKSLQRLLTSARSKNKITKSVKRKNSLDRAVVEARVHEALSEGRHLKSSELRKKVASVVFSINESTFRSYLHRMKEKGIIINHNGQRGVWALPNKPNDSID